MNDRNGNWQKGVELFPGLYDYNQGDLYLFDQSDLRVLLLDITTENIYTFNYQYFWPKGYTKISSWLWLSEKHIAETGQTRSIKIRYIWNGSMINLKNNEYRPPQNAYSCHFSSGLSNLVYWGTLMKSTFPSHPFPCNLCWCTFTMHHHFFVHQCFCSFLKERTSHQDTPHAAHMTFSLTLWLLVRSLGCSWVPRVANRYFPKQWSTNRRISCSADAVLRTYRSGTSKSHRSTEKTQNVKNS